MCAVWKILKRIYVAQYATCISTSGNPSGSKPIEDENLKNPSISTQGDTKKTAPRSRFRPARPAKAPKSRMKQNWFIEIPVRAVSLNEDRSSKMDEKGDYDTWSP
ncbi:hypothetical protein H2248_004428 [Termitomyces sp. 'cryptogamus']|nr:hypothetical protein H2248_004428 [Termitomyces sp. 'cryptogamus']